MSSHRPYGTPCVSNPPPTPDERARMVAAVNGLDDDHWAPAPRLDLGPVRPGLAAAIAAGPIGLRPGPWEALEKGEEVGAFVYLGYPVRRDVFGRAYAFVTGWGNVA